MAKRYIDESDIYKLFEGSNGIVKLHVAQIDELPRADVVEVVRCKDCKHFGKDMGYGKHDCKKYEMPYCLETDFCSYGKRKKAD